MLKQKCSKIHLPLTCQKKGQIHKVHIRVEKRKKKREKKKGVEGERQLTSILRKERIPRETEAGIKYTECLLSSELFS